MTIETLLLGVITVFINVLTIFLIVGKLHVKNREDITALQVKVDFLSNKIGNGTE